MTIRWAYRPPPDCRLATAFQVPPAAPAPAAATRYRVKGGDTLSGIARRHGTTVAELSAANSLDPEAPLKPGDRLTIPPRTR